MLSKLLLMQLLPFLAHFILTYNDKAETRKTRQRFPVGFPAPSYVICSFLYLFSSHFAVSDKKYPGRIIENTIKIFQIFINDRILSVSGASENMTVDIYSKITITTATLIQTFPIICKMPRNFIILVQSNYIRISLKAES